jgi:hypothetical protein
VDLLTSLRTWEQTLSPLLSGSGENPHFPVPRFPSYRLFPVSRTDPHAAIPVLAAEPGLIRPRPSAHPQPRPLESRIGPPPRACSLRGARGAAVQPAPLLAPRGQGPGGALGVRRLRQSHCGRCVPGRPHGARVRRGRSRAGCTPSAGPALRCRDPARVLGAHPQPAEVARWGPARPEDTSATLTRGGGTAWVGSLRGLRAGALQPMLPGGWDTRGRCVAYRPNELTTFLGPGSLPPSAFLSDLLGWGFHKSLPPGSHIQGNTAGRFERPAAEVWGRVQGSKGLEFHGFCGGVVSLFGSVGLRGNSTWGRLMLCLGLAQRGFSVPEPLLLPSQLYWGFLATLALPPTPPWMWFGALLALGHALGLQPSPLCSPFEAHSPVCCCFVGLPGMEVARASGIICTVTFCLSDFLSPVKEKPSAVVKTSFGSGQQLSFFNEKWQGEDRKMFVSQVSSWHPREGLWGTEASCCPFALSLVAVEEAGSSSPHCGRKGK